jgi:chromosome segregation ATPase
MESNSRYSIVERLTDKKLKLMEESSRLNSEVLKCKGRVNYLESKKVKLESQIKSRIENELQEFDNDISEAKSNLEIAQANIEASKVELEKKIQSVDEALASIKEISKDSSYCDPEKK